MKKAKRTLKKEIITFIVIVCITLLLDSGLILISMNYQKINHTPILNNGAIDLQTFDIRNRKVDYNLSGEWEFYYNQWIVSDNAEPVMTGKIHLPSRWNKEFKISRKGYASYRLMIKNPHIGDQYGIVLNNFRGSYQAFINQQLVTKCGTVSKEKGENFAKGRATYRGAYTVTSSEDLELVLEIGYNDFGGFYSVPWFTASSFSKSTSSLGNHISFLILFMMGNMLCFCIISLILNMGIYKKESLIYYSILLITLFLNHITSKDGCMILTQVTDLFDYNVYSNTNFVLIALAIISYIYFLSKVGLIKKGKYIFIAVISCIILLFIVLFGYANWCFVPVALFVLYEYSLLFKIVMNGHIDFSKRMYYIVLTILLFSVFTVEIFDATGLLVYGTEGITSFMLLLLMLCIAISNYVKIKNIAKENIKILKVENELKDIKEKTLRAQIKPHFIFNTLTCIQHLYHEDTEQGDYALSVFSKHLRLNVDMDAKKLVSFEEELDHIQNYFLLENMRYNNTINLYYDINYVDFKLPILSLQPFVENSIKHGKLMQNEAGWIQISSYVEEENIIIKIIDNGVGFDQKQIGNHSYGISNCKERFRLLLGATVSIQSVINQGTIVEIKFSKTKKGVDDNENGGR